MDKKKVIQKILRFFARKILIKYKPRIIGITGSVGKSTAKEMIFTVLNVTSLNVRKSEKNYNNEVGIPLTIIGASGNKKNLFGWLNVVFKVFKLLVLTQRYPEILVLELAVDHPGDMKYFCDFIPVEVGVLTSVGISHLENFGTKESILEEKSYLLKQASGKVLYNKDSIESELQNFIFENVIVYGIKNGTFKIREIGYNYEHENILAGMIFKVIYKEKIFSGKLNNLIGQPYLYGVLAALGVAEYFNLDIKKSLDSLQDIVAIPGHMSLLKGVKQTNLIDDTYNSAPVSVKEALNVMNEIDAERKVIVLGDMLELGSEELMAHKIVGKQVAIMENAIFIAVGSRMKNAMKEFRAQYRKNGIDVFSNKNKSRKGRVGYWFKNSTEAKKAIQALMEKGDLILVKGSQGMRMEKIIVEIMAEPNRRKELLVRQDENWINF